MGEVSRLATTKIISRNTRHRRIRVKVHGSLQRPRLSVFRSLNHIYAQLIDDTNGATLVAASTLDKEVKEITGHKGNIKSSTLVGGLIAKRAKEKGITSVVFDRGGFKYHGRVKALSEAARAAGLIF
ncbi:MAG: 50S ribosomal protein L18 [Nitrospirae bacterium]|nr:50S ribosomal protein L18 [Nitrospirota bacterium]MBF0541524.1 50S ribosomal protein L18 [Nitrospirota bacterium]